MRIRFCLFAMLLPLLIFTFVCTGCSDGTPPPKGNKLENQDFRQQQVAAVEVGFAFGPPHTRMALRPPELRARSFSGIDYNADSLTNALHRLKIPDEKTKSLVAEREIAINPSTNFMEGAEKLTGSLLEIRKVLEGRGDELLDKVVRIGFTVGGACEDASILLSVVKIDQSQLPKAVEMMKVSWGTFHKDVATANLPERWKAKLSRLDDNVGTFAELREFRDSCFDFWDMVRRENLPPGSDWVGHKHPIGFSFRYPAGWTTQDDPEHQSVLLLPPGVGLDAQTAVFVLVRVTRGVTDPILLRAYYETQLQGAEITRFSARSLEIPDASDHAAILAWDIKAPPQGAPGGLTVFVLLVNGYAIQLEVVAPTAVAEKYEPLMRQIAASIVWKS